MVTIVDYRDEDEQRRKWVDVLLHHDDLPHVTITSEDEEDVQCCTKKRRTFGSKVPRWTNMSPMIYTEAVE